MLKVVWAVALGLLIHKARGDKSQDTECYNSWDDGESYRGRVSTTVSGYQCQKWTAQSPHKHTRTPANYPFAGLEGNYCRNPDLGSARPWCYTMVQEKRWEVCEIRVCSDAGENETVDATSRPATPSATVETGTSASARSAATTSTTKMPPILDPTDCYKVADDGASYRGFAATTENGYPCQKWTEQSPHQHSRTSENFPSAGLDGNYCRNPDNEEEPWCYTTNPKRRWEYCSVPQCPEPESSTSAEAEFLTEQTVAKSSTSAATETDSTGTTQAPWMTTADAIEVVPTGPTAASNLTMRPFRCEDISCHAKAYCHPIGDEFECRCRDGYEGNGITCQSVDHCKLGPCHRHANCRNTQDGRFTCNCLAGFQGNGRRCRPRKIDPCEDNSCHSNARCIVDNSSRERYRCKCKEDEGYYGDGHNKCSNPCDIVRRYPICDENAKCIVYKTDTNTLHFDCQCKYGYHGNGKSCKRDPCGGKCPDNSTCQIHSRWFDEEYRCICEQGYTGCGGKCVETNQLRPFHWLFPFLSRLCP